MSDSTTQPEPADPGRDPGVDPPSDDEDGLIDQAEGEERPGVTKDPDDPLDTDFHVSPGPME